MRLYVAVLLTGIDYKVEPMVHITIIRLGNVTNVIYLFRYYY